MSELEQYRKEIDQIDGELAALFCRRMEIVEQIAAYKRKNDLPVCDPAREASVLSQRSASFERKDLLFYYEEFLGTLLALSKDYQKALGGDKT